MSEEYSEHGTTIHAMVDGSLAEKLEALK